MANKIKIFPIDSVGYRVTKLAEKKGLKKNDLYKIMMPEGVSEDLDSQNHAVNAALASGTMGINKLKHLAEYFHVSTDYLLGLGDNNGLSEDAALTMQLLTKEEAAMLSRILSRTEDVQHLLQDLCRAEHAAGEIGELQKKYEEDVKEAEALNAVTGMPAVQDLLKTWGATISTDLPETRQHLDAAGYMLEAVKHRAGREFENMIEDLIPAPQDPEKK